MELDRVSRRRWLQMAGGAAALLASQHAQASDDAQATSTIAESGARVQHLGKLFLDNPVQVTGADGATSLVLPDGRALWVFGDTVEGPFESIHGLELTSLRSNTGAIVPRQDASRGIREFEFLATEDGKRPRQLIAFAPEENPARTRLWGVHGAVVGRSAYLYYHRISLLDGVDVFENFKLEGMGLARAGVDDWQFSRLMTSSGSREFWTAEQPTYGVWVEATDEHLYLWGSLMTGMFLARVTPGQIEDVTAYEYLTAAPTLKRPDVKEAWGPRFEPSAVLFDNVPNEMSASYNPWLKQHLAIHAHGREGKIVMRTAPRRTGPWSEPRLVYEVKREQPTTAVYAAKEHPELARNGGRRVFVTYVDSASYTPELLEVTLP